MDKNKLVEMLTLLFSSLKFGLIHHRNLREIPLSIEDPPSACTIGQCSSRCGPTAIYFGFIQHNSRKFLDSIKIG